MTDLHFVVAEQVKYLIPNFLCTFPFISQKSGANSISPDGTEEILFCDPSTRSTSARYSMPNLLERYCADCPLIMIEISSQRVSASPRR
jgi:hypothetical protein